ncbi:hypothetical protein Mkiyose1385_21720 [Mycobacterium kiyosense]|nr:hypothetical protein Mkiyose1385_21720 [Mycobacterium kiyosense]
MKQRVEALEEPISAVEDPFENAVRVEEDVLATEDVPAIKGSAARIGDI